MDRENIIENIKHLIADPANTLPLLIEGATGIGKSAIVRDTCDTEGIEYRKMTEPDPDLFGSALHRSQGTNTLFEVEILHDFKSMERFNDYASSISGLSKRFRIPVVITSVPQTKPSKVYSEHGTLISTISDEEIDAIISTDEFNAKDVINAIMIIGNESLDPATEYMSWENKPYWNVASGKKEFMVEQVDGTWDYDPRIRKIGQYINSCGGFPLMQKIYTDVVFGEYRGTEGGLERAWAGIGDWQD